ncbi:MAG: hypothetical protein JSV24_09130 [Bacteroidales bacterium]|nr:MAG: hypothetical protein JSV24_09130 [Bacteroidales bacterium]
MKRPINIILFLFTILLICTAAKRITFNILAPAAVDIPRTIQTVAIIDRSVPENEKMNILEGILTGEGPGQDKLATQVAIDGLNSMLQNSSRFRVVRTAEVLKGSATGRNFPEPMDWNLIDELCTKHEVDAIISLESYDSDFIVTNGSRLVDRKIGDRTLKVPEFYASGVAKVNTGFRFYDPEQRSILDQYQFSHTMDWDVGGSSIQEAITRLLNRDAALKEASYSAGVLYGERISPTWFRVTRDYFRKAKRDPDLAEGARMMEANDWERAIIALERAVEYGRHRKVKGKAAHNLAVVHEILGNLEESKNWAVTAWGTYRIKKSRDYGYILTRRLQEQERLRQQLGE